MTSARIVELDLEAFGSFTRTRLDLSRSGVVHLVCGRNEAGKTTTRRAIRELFYGIAASTRDDYVHPARDLRISATLATPDGGRVRVSRRKGQSASRTLLDEAGRPVESALLRGILGNVGEDLFGSMFALDAEGLREGAEALLAGRGDVGESLFDAAIGGRGVHELLARLEREADDLFVPRATKRRLPLAIAALEAARRRVDAASRDPEAYEKQVESAAAKRADVARLADERLSVARERERLREAIAVVPKLNERAMLLAKRERIGPAPRLPVGFAEERRAAEDALRVAEARLGRATEAISALAATRDALEAPGSLAAIDPATLEKLATLVAEAARASRDLPGLERELAGARDEVAALARRLGRPTDPAGLDALDAVGVDAATEARVRSLAARGIELRAEARVDAERAGEHRRRGEELRSGLAAAAERGGRVDRGPDADLEAAIARAEALGDVEDRLARADRDLASRREAARRRIAALGCAGRSIEEIAELASPLPATIERFAEEREAIDRDLRAATERDAERSARVAELAREVERTRGEGVVTTEADLARAREERDAILATVREALAAGRRGGVARARELVFALAVAVARADADADRLRGDADRVSRLATLAKELDRATREAAGSGAEVAATEDRARTWERSWAAVVAPLGIEALAPREARAWLAEVARVRTIAEEIDLARSERDALAGAIASAREGLAAALGEALAPTGTTDLAATLREARALAREAEADVRERERLERALREHDAEADRLSARIERRGLEEEAWRGAWLVAMREIGLADDASAEEAEAILATLASLARKAEAAGRIRRAIHAAEASSRALADHLAREALALAPDLARADAVVAGTAFLERARRARRLAEEHDRIEAQLAGVRAERDAEDRARRRAAERIDALLGVAGAPDLAGLDAVLEQVRDAARVEERLAAIEEELASASGEADAEIETLAEATRDVAEDLVGAKHRLANLDRDAEELDARLDAEKRVLWTIEAGLAEFGIGAAAGDAAEEVERHVTRVRTLARRYACLRLAAELVRREVERYRERHQDPIVRRASEAFAALTLGRYAALRAEVDPDVEAGATLRCVDRDGAEMPIEALSEGARDQLYLALRLATIERFAASRVPPPIVLDDVLATSDDARVAAAFGVLAELAMRAQVIVLTHHLHHVPIARTRLGEGVVVHDLDALRAEADAAAE